VFVILFLVFGRRWRRRSDPSRQAEATLGERYAKGDIDEAEYRARLEVLRTNAAN
jgi:putative membrane protein